MITFHIHNAGNQGYYWHAITGNNRHAFNSPEIFYVRLRNCMNSIRSITQHMKDGTHDTWLTRPADRLRKQRGEKKCGARTRERISTCL